MIVHVCRICWKAWIRTNPAIGSNEESAHIEAHHIDSKEPHTIEEFTVENWVTGP